MSPPSANEPPADSPNRLAERVSEGDHGAFEKLVRRFDGGLRRLLRRRSGGRDDLAEELAHETWTAVWEALQRGRYDPEKAAISTFIYAVAHKRWLQYLRRSGQAPASLGAVDTLLEQVGGETGMPGDLVEAEELLGALRECLRAAAPPNGLLNEERIIVTGLVTGGTERSLAAELGIAPSTVHSRKLSAYAKLRKCMAAKGFVNETGERVADGSE